MAKLDLYNYPQGKSRVEPIGVMMFSCLMSVASLQVVVEAVKILSRGVFENEIPVLVLDKVTIVLMVLVVGWKAFLYILCYFVQSKSTSAQSNALLEAYTQDHLNDVFSNIISILALYISSIHTSSLWFLDSTVAILISLFIVWTWGSTAMEQIFLLIGKSADPEFLTILTALAQYHSPQVFFYPFYTFLSII